MKIYTLSLSSLIICHFLVILMLAILSFSARILFHPNRVEAKKRLFSQLNKLQNKKWLFVLFRNLTLLTVTAWTAITLEYIHDFVREETVSHLLIIPIVSGIFSLLIGCRNWYRIASILLKDKIGLDKTGYWHTRTMLGETNELTS